VVVKREGCDVENNKPNHHKEDIMGCSSCSNNKTGVPNGCKSNGNCASGSCGTTSVFDWLSDIQVPTGRTAFDVVEVSFKNSRKGFFRNEKNFQLHKGDAVTVEMSPGFDVGIITLTGALVKHQMNRKNEKQKPHELRKIARKSTEQDLESWKAAREKEYDTKHQARELIVSQKLQMKLSDVEYQGDGNKATFYYTAEQRVDFRELIKIMAEQFKIKIEMRQIGSRQEAGMLGGLGACGRELCCSTWLTDFRSVSTGAARYQQLSLNPEKLAGQCGKLKCCLNYELDQYTEELKSFPDMRKPLNTMQGTAIHIKTDVFKRLMWFLVKSERNSSIICLSVDRVVEIQEMNKSGKKIEDLNHFVEVIEPTNEPDYSNVDDQDDLTRFDNKFKKKKKGNNNNNRNRNKNKNTDDKGQPQGNNEQKNNPNATAEGGKKRPNKRRKKPGNNPNNPNKPQGNTPPAAPKSE
jgi:cell fate regulator YaaT (PSP1 superfamily)